MTTPVLNALARENEELRASLAQAQDALRQIRDYEWHPGQPSVDVRAIARAALTKDTP